MTVYAGSEAIFSALVFNGPTSEKHFKRLQYACHSIATALCAERNCTTGQPERELPVLAAELSMVCGLGTRKAQGRRRQSCRGAAAADWEP